MASASSSSPVASTSTPVPPEEEGAPSPSKGIKPSSQQNLETAKHRFVGFLSNYEVYTYLKELKDSGTTGGHGAYQNDRLYQLSTNTHMPTLIYESLRYFKSHNSPCMVQGPEIIENFLGKLNEFNLTKAEKLTILNLRPTQPVDIQAIVEESEERLTESQVARILEFVEECLPEVEQETGGIKTDGESE